MWNYNYDMIGLEIALVRFYHDIFLQEIEWISRGWNVHCLQVVRHAYCKYTLKNGLSAVNFESAGMRSAYIFLNTPCFSSTVAYHFLNMLQTNPRLLRDVISRGTLNVCCLGGGPATEVVAIAKALELILKFFCSTSRTLKIHATVVDIDSGWSHTLKKVTQSWWKRIDQSVLKFKLTFVQADLTQQPLSEAAREALRNSDLVTMVKFVSAVYGTKGRDKISEMLQQITSNIREDGVLFFMNCSRFACIDSVSESISSSVDMTSIYGPLYDSIYCLSPPSMRLCFDLYFQHYGQLPPTVQCKNHVVAWCKRANN